MTGFEYADFRAQLDALPPIGRAQAVFPAIQALPIGARVGNYVREDGKDRWRCEYGANGRGAAHHSYTGAWSVAMDVGFPRACRANEIEAIARAAHAVMVAQGLDALPSPDLAAECRAMEPLTAEEAREIVDIAQAPQAPVALSRDGQWRREYREQLAKKRLIGVQPDLFSGSPVMYYRRHKPRPPVVLPTLETTAAKLERIEGDPLATFGPPSGRGQLAGDQLEELLRHAANWLNLGQRVRVVGSSGSIDGSLERRILGREGVIWRLGSRVFRDRVYVFLDPVGGERSDKIEFLEIRDLEPIE